MGEEESEEDANQEDGEEAARWDLQDPLGLFASDSEDEVEDIWDNIVQEAETVGEPFHPLGLKKVRAEHAAQDKIPEGGLWIHSVRRSLHLHKCYGGHPEHRLLCGRGGLGTTYLETGSWDCETKCSTCFSSYIAE